MQPARFCFAALLLTSACLGDQDASPEAGWVTNPVDTPDGRLSPTYQVIDERTSFQGNIDLGDAAEIETRVVEKPLVVLPGHEPHKAGAAAADAWPFVFGSMML